MPPVEPFLPQPDELRPAEMEQRYGRLSLTVARLQRERDALRDACILIPKPGDVLVLRSPEPGEDLAVVESARLLHEETGCLVLVLAPGYELKHLDEDAMREAGWVRIPVPIRMDM